MSQLLYVACPFSHKVPTEREHRFRTACRASAILMKHGIVVFSPLSHSVPINEFLSDIDSHDFWMSMDIPLLHRSDELLVLGMRGWTESLGVKKEMFECISLRKPITVIDEADIERLPAVPKHARRFLTSSILTEVYDDK